MYKWNKIKENRLKSLYKESLSLKIIRMNLGCQYTDLNEKIKELGLEREVNKEREGRANENISSLRRKPGSNNRIKKVRTRSI
jgi:hypothetical protein